MKVATKRLTRAALFLACGIAPMLMAAPVQAQIGETLLLPPIVPTGFNRGRNLSVLELPRRDFDPAGIRLGSFSLLPSVASAGGVTSNTYYTSDPTASMFLSTTPTVQLVSKWTRHQLMFTGTGTIRDYIGESRRNEKTWRADTKGRIDLGRFSSIALEETSSNVLENQFSGEVTPVVAALSSYRRDFVSAIGTYQAGRARTTLSADYSMFRFARLPLLDGGSRDQTYRNRNIGRVTGQFEFARTPSLAFFVQGSYANQDFAAPVTPGGATLDSNSYRFLGGTNFDISGSMRGVIGIGYTRQTFTSPLYKPVSGLSVEGRVELFPSRLTTVTLSGRRIIEVTTLSTGGAYWDNRLSVRVDREVWRSLLLNTTAEYSRQTYVTSGFGVNTYKVGIGAEYLSSRNVVVDATVNYGNRVANANSLGNDFDELRAELGLTFRI